MKLFTGTILGNKYAITIERRQSLHAISGNKKERIESVMTVADKDGDVIDCIMREYGDFIDGANWSYDNIKAVLISEAKENLRDGRFG